MREHRDLAGLPAERHEAMLREVVVGDLDPESPEVRKLRAECELCASRLDEDAAVLALLDEEGRGGIEPSKNW